MTAPAIEKTAAELRQFLQHHTADCYRPVPLAKAIGEKDIRRVRTALREMASAGELVSCKVEIPGQGIDEEFRLAAGGVPLKIRAMSSVSQTAVRRPDNRHIPSRMTDLHRERPQRKAIAVKREASYSVAPTKTVAPESKIRPFYEVLNEARPPVPGGAPARQPPVPKPVPAPVAPPAKAPVVTQDDIPAFTRAAPPPSKPEIPAPTTHHLPRRRVPIMEYVKSVGRRVTIAELTAHLRKADPNVKGDNVSSVVQSLRQKGELCDAGKIREPLLEGRLMAAYATPEVAQRIWNERPDGEPLYPKNTKGSGGEATSATPAPITGKAGESPAAPRDADRSAQKTAQGAPQEPLIDVRWRLTTFFSRCDGNWYGLPWLVRTAGGDVPATLTAIAELQREGRLSYAEADRAPIWHPVEGSW